MIKKVTTIFLVMILILEIYSIKPTMAINTTLSASSKTVDSGKEFEVNISSSIILTGWTISLSNDGGCTFQSVSGGEINGKNIYGTSSKGTKSLATYKFTAPKVTKDTKYYIKFSGTDMCDVNTDEVNETSCTATITVKAPNKTPVPTQLEDTNKPTSSTNSNKTQNSDKKTNNTSNKTTTTKKTETKKETPVVETKEEEEATPLWGISEVKLIGVKENEEKIDLELDKKFDINTYEYLCNVSSDIKKIEVQKEAYEYNEFVTITGLEENLKEGENIITLKLTKDGQKELEYTIKVDKEAKPKETVITNTDIVEENKQETEKMITMPLWSFILLEVILAIVSSAITAGIIKIILNHKNKIKSNKDNGNNFEKIDMN